MFKEVDVTTFDLKLFNKLNKEWALLSAGNKDAFNTMTISWGEMGTLWNKPVMTCFVRPQRYTKEFIDSNDQMTLSFFNGEHMKDLTILGRESGRDGDKIAKTDLTPTFIENLPTFEEADIVVVGKKLYEDTIKPECFLDETLVDKNYPNKDFHTMYICEVEKIYMK